MTELTLYEILNCELNVTLGFAKDVETAKKIAHGRGFWGADATVTKTILKIFNSEEDYCEWIDAKKSKERTSKQ